MPERNKSTNPQEHKNVAHENLILILAFLLAQIEKINGVKTTFVGIITIAFLVLFLEVASQQKKIEPEKLFLSSTIESIKLESEQYKKEQTEVEWQPGDWALTVADTDVFKQNEALQLEPFTDQIMIGTFVELGEITEIDGTEYIVVKKQLFPNWYLKNVQSVDRLRWNRKEYESSVTQLIPLDTQMVNVNPGKVVDLQLGPKQTENELYSLTQLEEIRREYHDVVRITTILHMLNGRSLTKQCSLYLSREIIQQLAAHCFDTSFTDPNTERQVFYYSRIIGAEATITRSDGNRYHYSVEISPYKLEFTDVGVMQQPSNELQKYERNKQLHQFEMQEEFPQPGEKVIIVGYPGFYQQDGLSPIRITVEGEVSAVSTSMNGDVTKIDLVLPDTLPPTFAGMSNSMAFWEKQNPDGTITWIPVGVVSTERLLNEWIKDADGNIMGPKNGSSELHVLSASNTRNLKRLAQKGGFIQSEQAFIEELAQEKKHFTNSKEEFLESVLLVAPDYKWQILLQSKLLMTFRAEEFIFGTWVDDQPFFLVQDETGDTTVYTLVINSNSVQVARVHNRDHFRNYIQPFVFLEN